MHIVLYIFYMFYIINTMKIDFSQFYTTFVLEMRERSRFEPGSPSPLFEATPLYKNMFSV